MGAAWGFAGPPDLAMARMMGVALAHRGGAEVHFAASRDATLGLREPHGPLSIGRVAPAIYEDPEQRLTISLCGWLTGIEDSRLENAICEDDPQRFYRVLAQRYRDEGLSVVERLRGAFVLVIRDRSRLHITRDGAGNRTVFYARHAGRWLFGIEPKALTSLPGFSKRIRPAALAQYLACSFVPGAGTMFENLYELRSGHWVTLEPDREPVLTCWFRFEEDEAGNSAEMAACAEGDRFVDEFREEMSRAVRERIPHNQPIGVFLSGGLDSSIVTAELARQVGGENVRTWTIHFGTQYANELEFARAVAEHCGTIHEEVLIEPRKFIPRLRRMVWHLDEPIGDPITQPNFELAAYVSKLGMRSIFNGEGGDPCFGGPKNIPMMLHHWYGGVEREPNFRERRYAESYRRAWEEIDLLLSDDVKSQIDLERDLDGVFAPYFQTDVLKLFLNRLTTINIREKGAHLIQPKVERMLGAHGLTPLAPLFDERLIRLSFRMPTRYKLKNGIEKVILKQVYADQLPEAVVHRPKSGMRVPVHYWFRAEMRRYARRILSPREVRRAGLFNPNRVQEILAYDGEEGRGRFGMKLWMLMTLELWRRIVVEGETV